MKTLEIIGYKRANLGKAESKKIRLNGEVPCVVYGNGGQTHFRSPMILFRDLVYTKDAHFVTLNIEGEIKKAILQDIQFHPVSEIILHADFLEIQDDKEIKMDIPLKIVGTSPGVVEGGRLAQKAKTLRVKALPANMPEFIEVDITPLALGKSMKVKALSTENYEILNSPMVSIVTIEIPRALKGKKNEDGDADA
ncbi:MAG: 50S ribosomal protein L25/general stress protein Ctc [Cyclobacteriaceae bacterium]|nr:50S ribosomal protein L25/general stress protein Ctc [Cyclobacteriaceae bacterium]MCH8514870.1 50S ribosomal protein L25/general stress protein Ctc [Cyclobacteriaceae bacterium]